MARMAQYLLFHKIDPRIAMSGAKAMVDLFTVDIYCITTWAAVGARKMAFIVRSTVVAGDNKYIHHCSKYTISKLCYKYWRCNEMGDK